MSNFFIEKDFSGRNVNSVTVSCEKLYAKSIIIPGGEKSPGSTVVFRPQYSGDTSNGVFGKWAELCAVLPYIEGPKYIFFDDSLLPFGDPIVIPPGAWDMTEVTWYVKLSMIHSPPVIFTQINISDGATVNGLCGISGPSVTTYFGTTTPAFTPVNIPNTRNAAIALTDGAKIACLGTQPFISISDGFYEIINTFATQWIGIPLVVPPPGTPYSTTNPISVGATAQLIFVMGTGCICDDNVISGNGDLLFIRLAPVILSIPLVQPNFTGTMNVNSEYVSPDTYKRTIPPIATDDENVGYKVSDVWVDTVALKFYTAVKVNVGAAVWNGPY